MGIPAQGVFALKKNTSILVVVLALTVLATTAAWFGKDLVAGEKTVENSVAIRERPGAVQAETAKDSDGDGLKDWEEAIWRTDPANADTDDDGMPDGAEIAQSRDPLRTGPNDQLIAGGADTAGGDGEPAIAGNITHALAQNLLQSGVLGALEADGNITSTEFLSHLSLPPSLNPDIVLGEAAVVTAGDIRAASRNDPAAVREYFNLVSAAYERYAHTPQRGDIEILAEALRDGDYGRLAEIDRSIAALERLTSDLGGLAVPAGYTDFAVRELNYLLQTKRALGVIRATGTDPLATLLILPKRLELLNAIAQFHLETSRTLLEQNIFSQR